MHCDNFTGQKKIGRKFEISKLLSDLLSGFDFVIKHIGIRIKCSSLRSFFFCRSIFLSRLAVPGGIEECRCVNLARNRYFTVFRI